MQGESFFVFLKIIILFKYYFYKIRYCISFNNYNYLLDNIGYY